jgi:phenylpropionate dioxygenase-like ring-hydroxylating dioxygenase large terminal subunit
VRVAGQVLARGEVGAVDVDGDEFVIWRGHDGIVRSAPRIRPHLDHDLADGYVVGTELVCAGHGWAFDGNGNMYKRNEFGRVDTKGSVPVLAIDDHDGNIEVGVA